MCLAQTLATVPTSPRGMPPLCACLIVQGHTDAIATLAWSPDDSMLATCGQDRILRLWSSEDGRCIQELSHHTQQVSAVAWLPDSECWVPACSDPPKVLMQQVSAARQQVLTAALHQLGLHMQQAPKVPGQVDSQC